MISRLLLGLALLAALATDSSAVGAGPRVHAAPKFVVSFTRAARAAPITGRLVVIVSKTAEPEPRMLVSPSGPAIFAIDLDQLHPSQSVTVDSRAIGYPMDLDQLPAGEYWVQAVIDVYTQVHRADGHTIWVRINDGRIEPFQIAAGNLYSDVQ